jgi:ABC-type lipoprotein export system ATPase subunit
MALYGRGSEWRRWDLHIHAPGTALNDGFGDWDEFVDAVEQADGSLAVVGVTDYCSINTYKAFKSHLDDGRMENIKLAIPNIEFRVSPETKVGKGINLHLLVSPDDPEHVDRIEEALSRLKINRDGEDIPCSRAGLTRLGKLTNKNLSTSPTAAYREGVNQFKVDVDIFRSWFESEKWLSQHALVAVAAGSNDGASGLKDGGYQSTRREIYRFAQVVLSGNPAERDAWLGRGTIAAEELARLGGQKPVIHGSDAHCIDDLFQPDQDRFCWIKADPTFDGLRQILYEPEDRVHIDDAPPIHPARPAVQSITLRDSSEWFEDDREIPLNSGLVAIVGLKGSGKTALADLIALGCGAEPDEESSFVTRAQEHLTGARAELRWTDGDSASACLPYKVDDAVKPRVKYLSQKFVDRLCGGENLTDELQREVEDVIFQHLDEDAQMGCVDFRDLREFRTTGLRETRAAIAEQINDESEKIAAFEERYAAVQKKAGRRSLLPTLLSNLTKTQPKVNNAAASAKLAQLTVLRDQRQKLAQAVAKLKGNKEKVSDVERQIKLKISAAQTFWQGIEPELKRLGFTGAEITKLRPAWENEPQIFKKRRDALDADIKASTGTPGQPDDATLAGMDVRIKALEGELELDKSKKTKLAEIAAQRQKLLEEKRRLDEEATWAEQSYKKERQAASDQRMTRYLEYFSLLEEEKAVLQELYEPLKSALAGQGSQEQKLELVCRVAVNINPWIERGAELFDQRKAGAFRYDQIEKIARLRLRKAWLACDAVKIREGIEECLNHIRETHALKNQLKSGFHPKDVAAWLFGVDHLDVRHAIHYEGRDLQLLSPGTKGIVLLILYLAVDRHDDRPLIVDQPDENLDNQSTYQILRRYFREAKRRRQIIIITHNPNLVVNTDAEQVIVAESELRSNGFPTITYTFGSLEASEPDGTMGTSIREAVCRIMEGGRDAFRQRESRYGAVLKD